MSDLKQIKRHHERQLKSMDKKLTTYQIHPDDVSWLINRVGELENENRVLRALAKSNKYIGEQYLEQNKRYREALEFYADEENYMPNVFNQWEPAIKIWKDSGETARKVLEGEE